LDAFDSRFGVTRICANHSILSRVFHDKDQSGRSRQISRENDQAIWVVAVWHGARIPQEPEDTPQPRDD
jgi:hypothetical protein